MKFHSPSNPAKKDLREIESDVVVIGGGPAGLSTALHLTHMAPDIAGRTIVLEAKRHPREKLCGGAISVPGIIVLRRLGLDSPPAFVPANTLRVRYGPKSYQLRGRPIVRIHNRIEFDAWLAERTRQAGIRLHENEPALNIRRTSHGFLVETPGLRVRTRVIVGADGSRGTSRRLLGVPGVTRLSRLVEVLVPTDPTHELFHSRAAELRFGIMDRGAQGYAWEFPVFAHGLPHLNLGVFDARIAPDPRRPNLREIMARQFPEVFDGSINEPTLKGHPLHWFHRGTELSLPGVLFVGDAAGADPLFGEGISFALEYGHVAAAEIIDAFKGNDFSFKRYRRLIIENGLLRDLPRRTRLARLAYAIKSPWLRSLGWSCIRPFAHRVRWKEPAPGFIRRPGSFSSSGPGRETSGLSPNRH